jgi:hypothetical protein
LVAAGSASVHVGKRQLRFSNAIVHGSVGSEETNNLFLAHLHILSMGRELHDLDGTFLASSRFRFEISSRVTGNDFFPEDRGGFILFANYPAAQACASN